MKKKSISQARLNFARNFSARRKDLQLSYAEIHRRTGLAISYVSAVASGKRNVSLDTAAMLAVEVGQDLASLLQS